MRFGSATGLCGNGCVQFALSKTILICCAARCAKLKEGLRHSWSTLQKYEHWNLQRRSQQRRVGRHLVEEPKGQHGHQGEEEGLHLESHEMEEDPTKAVG